MNYEAKEGDLNSGANLSLFSCMKDKVPVLVIVTSRASTPYSHALYRLLGPAIIEDFNSITRRFRLRGGSHLISEQLTQQNEELESFKLQMRNRLITPFRTAEGRSSYLSLIREIFFLEEDIISSLTAER